jgi:hypothetical protein
MTETELEDPTSPPTTIYFSDVFGVDPQTLRDYGAFDVSLVNDLPLFIDPFLLFHSDKPIYRALHDEIIRYVVFLKDRASSPSVSPALIRAWFTFKEVKETWLGYSLAGNKGRGLGPDFAEALKGSLSQVFKTFGTESVTNGSHLEKLCLIGDGVGRDSISDFATNLIKPYLISFTEEFARLHLREDQAKAVQVPKARFDYDSASWAPGLHKLPYFADGYVLLTPIDMLTKDEVWINRTDLLRDYDHIAASVPNDELRERLGFYFHRKLSEIHEREEARRKKEFEQRAVDDRRRVYKPRDPTQRETDEARSATIVEFPELLDYYIRQKEEAGDQAEELADERVRSSERLFIGQVRQLANLLATKTRFYEMAADTTEGVAARVTELKRAIEEEGGAELLHVDGHPIEDEADLRIILRLVWCNNPQSEAAPRPLPGASFSQKQIQVKLGSNLQINKFLAAAKDDPTDLTRRVIVCFSAKRQGEVGVIRKALELADDPRIVVIRAWKQHSA